MIFGGRTENAQPLHLDVQAKATYIAQSQLSVQKSAKGARPPSEKRTRFGRLAVMTVSVTACVQGLSGLVSSLPLLWSHRRKKISSTRSLQDALFQKLNGQLNDLRQAQLDREGLNGRLDHLSHTLGDLRYVRKMETMMFAGGQRRSR